MKKADELTQYCVYFRSEIDLINQGFPNYGLIHQKCTLGYLNWTLETKSGNLYYAFIPIFWPI